MYCCRANLTTTQREVPSQTRLPRASCNGTASSRITRLHAPHSNFDRAFGPKIKHRKKSRCTLHNANLRRRRRTAQSDFNLRHSCRYRQATNRPLPFLPCTWHLDGRHKRLSYQGSRKLFTSAISNSLANNKGLETPPVGMGAGG